MVLNMLKKFDIVGPNMWAWLPSRHTAESWVLSPTVLVHCYLELKKRNKSGRTPSKKIENSVDLKQDIVNF